MAKKAVVNQDEWALDMKKLALHAPWVLRVTELKDKTGPVFVVKERVTLDSTVAEDEVTSTKGASHLVDRGMVYGQSLRICSPILKEILGQVIGENGIPLELQLIFRDKSISFRGNVPLNAEAGAKLALIFKLQERVLDMDRVELIAWRVERFSREEASYWLSRITHFGLKANMWAQAGLRLMLGGQPKDKGIHEMLEKIRK